ncbi:MAG: glycosyltransferase [Fusobacterium sp.]|nr:glycosyltransferase [Fusobacterium sp.]
MRIQAIAPSNVVNYRNSNRTKVNNNSVQPYFHDNLRTMAFTGNNPNHGIFVGAEIKGLQQKGGVATVMFDYASIPGMEEAIVLPYHNAQLTYDSKGKYAGEVKIHRFPEGHEHAGKPFWTGVDLDKTSLKEVYSDPKKYILLDELSTIKAPWDSTQEATLLRVHDKGAIRGINHDVFLIYSDTLGTMKEPYADGAYMSKTAKEAVADAAKRKFEPSPYAEFNRLFVEFKDSIINNTRTSDGTTFSPMTVSCSDSQTAYIPYYMRAKNIQDMNPIYTLHNGGDGYTGQIDGRTMFQNLLLAEDETTRNNAIKNLLDNKEFLQHNLNGTTDEFFKQFMPQLVDASGSFNPTLIPFMYAQKDDRYVKGVNTVSKGYAEGMAYNEAIPSGIRPFFKSLLKDGMADGILNPMNDGSFSPFAGKGGYLPGYNKEFTVKYPDGHEEVIKPFRLLDEKLFKNADGTPNVTEASLKHYDEVKLDNQINFFKRVLGTYDADGFAGEIGNLKGEKVRNLLINGLDGKDVELIGHVSPEILQKFEDAKAGKGKAPKVFVSWGRIDDQKALDSVMKAFAKFKEANPDGVLVLGGPSLVDAEGNVADCTKKTIDLVNKYTNSKELKGSIVFMNGFAPNKVLAAIADAAVFPSRFAPCELTDLESMKYFLRVIASNCQGLADKNFDATMDGAENATGYKTIHEFFGINQTTIENDNEISKIFREGIANERLTGFNKLYADAEKEYLARTGNSNLLYRKMIADNMASELSGTLDDNAMKSVNTIVQKLALSEAETTKLKGLPITDAADRALIAKFAENKKVSPKEVEKLTQLINASTLEAGEKTRFTQLLDGTTQASVEKDLFNLLFNKENLKDKKIKLTGPAITEEGLNTIRKYLADTTQENRHLLDDNLIEKGIIDEEQLKAAKRIFDYDPVIHYMHDTPKFQNKYKALIERCRNEIMEKEIFNCMQRAANETPEMRLTMLRNHVRLNSSWDGNANLTGITRENGTRKVSSYYLYNEMFSRERTAEQKKKPFVNYLQNLLEKIKPKPQKTNQKTYNDATDAIQEAAKTASGMSKGLKIALGAGAAILALGGGYYAMNKSGTKSNDHGDTFKPAAQPALQNPYLATK